VVGIGAQHKKAIPNPSQIDLANIAALADQFCGLAQHAGNLQLESHGLPVAFDRIAMGALF
jgi:hypothetical protein